jgi:hypothetical protein
MLQKQKGPRPSGSQTTRFLPHSWSIERPRTRTGPRLSPAQSLLEHFRMAYGAFQNGL